MRIDPDRAITITLPFGMVEQLRRAKPILSMFRDEGDISSVIDIIDAIYEGALEYVREEEGEIKELLDEDDDQGFFSLDDDDKDGTTKN